MLAPWKPDEVGFGEVVQAEALQPRHGVPSWRSQHDLVRGDMDVGHVRVGSRRMVDEARVQPARAEGFDLIQRDQRTELQLCLRAPSAELPEGCGYDAVPWRALRETHPQRPDQSARRTPGADRRLVHFLENPTTVLHEDLPARAQANAPWQAVEPLESDLTFQVLDLTGQCGLGHMQPLRRASVVLVFSDGHEVAQVPQFHIDRLRILVR